MNQKVAEYTKAVVDKRPCFHISLVVDVSPQCDCHSGNDAAIVPDVGMFASFDPVALDVACADAVNAQPPIQNSQLKEHWNESGDHFHKGRAQYQLEGRYRSCRRAWNRHYRI